jgi:hypothetical protein
MKDSEEAIEKMLSALREVEAPVGMERRILEQLEARAEEKSPRWRWMVPVACVAVLAAMIAVLFMPRTRVPVRVVHVQSAALPRSVEQGRPMAHETAHVQKAAYRRRRSSAVARDIPAPPLPLTDQERLLLRVVHQHNPGNLAILEPAKQAAELAKDKEQFQGFFGKNIVGGDD